MNGHMVRYALTSPKRELPCTACGKQKGGDAQCGSTQQDAPVGDVNRRPMSDDGGESMVPVAETSGGAQPGQPSTPTDSLPLTNERYERKELEPRGDSN